MFPKSRGLIVVLVSTRNPLNIGAAARAMSNFGFSCLRLVNPFEPSFREAKSAVGAAEVLARAEEYKNVAAAIADCTWVVGTTAARNRELHHPVKLLPQTATLIRKRCVSGRVALLFGSEKRGLSTRDLSYCDWLLNIPTREENVSMNLGQAVAVCLYELSRSSKKMRSARNEMPASAQDAERITAILIETLQASGYINPSSAESKEEKMRRLVKRLKLSKADGELWLGMLRQINWKISH